MSAKVRDWMKHPVVWVKPRDSAAHARHLMEEHRVNQLPVLAGSRLVGIVTDRDLRDAFPSLAEILPLGRRRREATTVDPENIVVEDLMTHDVLTLGPDDPLGRAAETMRRERIGGIPVVEGGKMIGIITRSDLLGALAASEALNP